LLSLAPHEHLVPIVRRHGIEAHFVRIDGRTDTSHAGKAERMVRHMAALGGVDADRVVVIGDALDDAVAAAHVGARAVLYTGGSHSRTSLEAAGMEVPVVDSLAEAVEVAERLAA
jgi:phosphoglycolate phosphatase-like HAD superfamily hydrolase